MGNFKRYEEALIREREKLHQMIVAAMNGPIAQNRAVLRQSRKVDALTIKLEKVKNKA